MAISNLSTAQTPLLDDASLYYKGRPVHRSNSGGWRYASFIIVVEIAERFANYGISSNLITFLTGPLGESTAVAATQVNAWSGASSLLPLLGAFIADSFLGQYRTIILAFLLYILVPKELRSVGLALYLSIFGVGSFLSSFFISAIEKMTGEGGQDSWFANNLNRAHLDYFYWLLAALSAMGLALYLCSAKSYIYARGSTL